MKLMIVTHNMAGGGCERVIARLLFACVNAGDDCTLVTECAGESFYALPTGVMRHALLEKMTMAAADVPRAYQKLRALVKRETPDLVLAMPEKVNVWTVLFLLGTGVPVVVSERNDPMRHPESRVKRLLRRMVYPFAAGFIFQTQMAADYFPERIRARGAVLDNPLDTDRMPPANTGARDESVIGAGRLNAQKNFPLLIIAFSDFVKTHPSWRLVLFGEGGERERLSALCRDRLPDGSWSMPGQTEQLYEEFSRCGMFALSSDFEGMPNALIEAMAMGAPCAASDCRVGGPASLIESGENGLLFPVGDAPALTAAMARIADDPSFAARLSAQAATIRTRLDERAVCGKWRETLARFASGR